MTGRGLQAPRGDPRSPRRRSQETQLPIDPAAHLKDPVMSTLPSTTANLWCMWVGLLSTRTAHAQKGRRRLRRRQAHVCAAVCRG